MDTGSAFSSQSQGQMRPRASKILFYLLDHKKPIRTSELARQNAVNPRTIRYDLEALESWLEQEPLNLVRKNGHVWLEGTNESKDLIRAKLDLSVGEGVMRSQSERVAVLIAKVLSSTEPLVVKQMTDLLQVSARTIYGELDDASRWLESAGLQLIRKPHFGMVVQGTELLRRYACHRLITEVLQFSDTWLERRVREGCFPVSFYRHPVVSLLTNPKDVQTLVRMFDDPNWHTEAAFQVDVSLVLQLAIVLQSVRTGRNLTFQRQEMKRLQENAQYEDVQNLLRQIGDVYGLELAVEEVCYIALHILCTQPQDVREIIEQDDPSPAEEMVRCMLASIERVLSVNLMNEDPDLLKGLVMHVKPMLYRVMFGIPIQNKLLDQIRSEHALAFHMAVVSSQVMEKATGRPVNSTEVGYLALHFAAALEKAHFQSSIPLKHEGKIIRALVVCGGGIGTSRILASRIEAEFPNIKIVSRTDAEGVLGALLSGAEIAISTIPLVDFPIPWFVVNPLLPQNDITQIQNWLGALYGKQYGIPLEQQVIKEIVHVMTSHYKVLDQAKLELEVSRLIERTRKHVGYSNVQHVEGCGDGRRQSDPMLLELITENTVRANVEATTPRDVILAAGGLLLRQGSIGESYVKAMEDSLIQNGPYMVIVPGVAILHARPEDGVNAVCMSLVTLKKGVRFGHKDNDPVDIAIVMGAIDHSRHLRALSELMQLLSSVEALSKIRGASSGKEILEAIRQIPLISEVSTDGEAI